MHPGDAHDEDAPFPVTTRREVEEGSSRRDARELFR
jgi:hypothetical protein